MSINPSFSESVTSRSSLRAAVNPSVDCSVTPSQRSFLFLHLSDFARTFREYFSSRTSVKGARATPHDSHSRRATRDNHKNIMEC